ncbi:hypothetical protein Acor_06250 [Acrocarpospora corrugata]|uniref:Uncharacterized protein n=1 Tax=Acrocarpospora corrugata TaxID=35763 RepID=A0A5M3VQ09_9ACTN|nr:hypothetical protein [Acrocarpospora corrugata]GER98563.1 hypothetical protein Acor_06250 [Acrocarpospora corrugata]
MDTEQHTPIRRTRSGRLRQALTVVSVAAVTAVALAGPAAAEPSPQVKCKSGTGHVICFSLDRLDDGNVAVHLGIDISMSRADAQAIIDHPGEELIAKIIGQDPAFDNTLMSVPVTWSTAGDAGLSAEFDRLATFAQLNEDDGYFDGYIDELFGRIQLTDPRTTQTRTFTSPVITGYY